MKKGRCVEYYCFYVYYSAVPIIIIAVERGRIARVPTNSSSRVRSDCPPKKDEAGHQIDVRLRRRQYVAQQLREIAATKTMRKQ